MKLKVKVSNTVEVDIPVPAYRKLGSMYWAVLGEDACIYTACEGALSPAIQKTFVESAYGHAGTKDCTKEEYMKVYTKALSMLIDLITGENE